MICSIDPAFKKCAFVLMTPDLIVKHAENYSFISIDKIKQSQTQYTLDLYASIEAKVQQINTEYAPVKWIIEAQIGQYACFIVQALITVAIRRCSQVEIHAVSPKLKLKNAHGSDFTPDATTKKYNQNKNKGMAFATSFLKNTNQIIKLDRDIADALLMAVAFISSGAQARSQVPLQPPISTEQLPSKEEVSHTSCDPVQVLTTDLIPDTSADPVQVLTTDPVQVLTTDLIPEVDSVIPDQVLALPIVIPAAQTPKKKTRKTATKQPSKKSKSIEPLAVVEVLAPN